MPNRAVSEPPPPDSPRANVLLVDDHPPNLLALEAVLAPLGARLVRAGSGAEALAHLLREEFAAALLDVQMPVLDGFETAALIRQRERTRELPILFVTALHRDEAHQLKGYALGAVDYLPKPFHPDVVRAKVGALIALWKRGEALRRREADLRARERDELMARERAARAEAGAQRATLAQLVAQTPVAVAVCRGPSHVFELANPAYERAFGRRGVVGRAVRVVFPEPELARQGLWAIWDRVYVTGEPFVADEYPVAVDRDGDGRRDEAFFALTLSAVRDAEGAVAGVMAVAVEVTGRVRSARLAALRADMGAALVALGSLPGALAASAEAVARHLDLALARVWTAEGESGGLTLQASAGLDAPAGAGLTGAYLAALERAPLPDRDAADDPSAGVPAWAAREAVVAFAAFPLLAGPQLVGVLGAFARRPFTADDATELAAVAEAMALGVERRRAEEERGRLLAREQRARAEAEEASAVKDRFLATVSHELRTPLSSILGWARMLRSGGLPEGKRAHGLEAIERNARAQARLVDDLLDISRIASGKLRLEVAPVDLRAVVEAALDTVRPAAEAKALRLEASFDPAAGTVAGDAARLHQVAWNLLSNAVKFTPKGGRVSVRLGRDGTSVELAVEDTGQGIAPDFLPHVFDPFRQADEGPTRASGGLGLGLAIVRQLVELHGGTVHARSGGPGLGATFVVRLPLGAPP